MSTKRFSAERAAMSNSSFSSSMRLDFDRELLHPRALRVQQQRILAQFRRESPFIQSGNNDQRKPEASRGSWSRAG